MDRGEKRRMIVCSCNLLTEGEIRTALSDPDGPRCVRDVYDSLGCPPNCGGCAGAIAHLVEQAREEELYLEGRTLQKAAA